jgi:beta-glucanase (GH16 family)
MIIKLANAQTLCKPFEYNGNLPYNKQGLIADYNSENIRQTNGLLDLHLTKNTGGTRLSIADTLHYGTIEATLKVSPGMNVVSSFILMAENKDEIDFEFVQNTLNKTNVIQTNYFYKGIPIFDKNAKMYKTKNPLADFYHTYSIHWTPNFYEWRFNKYTLRKLFRNETKNYPDSPSKVQFGIWEAKPSSWAGTGINWNSQPYILSIKSLKLSCNSTTASTITPTSSITSSTSSESASSITSSTSSESASAITSSTSSESTSAITSTITSAITNLPRNYEIKLQPQFIWNLVFSFLIINLM